MKLAKINVMLGAASGKYELDDSVYGTLAEAESVARLSGYTHARLHSQGSHGDKPSPQAGSLVYRL